MGAMMWRVAKSFFVHFVLLLVALGLVWLLVQGQESLAASVRLRYQARSPQALISLLDDQRGRLMMWCSVSFIVSWLASSVFLCAAERANPAHEVEARGRLGLWSLMFILTIVFVGFYAWQSLIVAGVSAMLDGTTFLTAVLIGGLAVLLAYFFATGLMVRRVMRPSVPFAARLPTLWS